MSVLSNICKMYGQMTVTENGKKVIWVWDYANDIAVKKSDMTKEQFASSEKAKWMRLKNN